MRFSFGNVLFLLLLLVSLLASLAPAQDQPEANRLKQAACGQDHVKFDIEREGGTHPQGKLQPGKALVYVVGEAKYLDGAVVRVGMDGAWVGATRGNSYMFFLVEPGEHHLCGDWDPGFWHGSRQSSLASLFAESGQTYYVRARTLGAREMTKLLDLELINRDEGQFLVASSVYGESRPQKSPSSARESKESQ